MLFSQAYKKNINNKILFSLGYNLFCINIFIHNKQILNFIQNKTIPKKFDFCKYILIGNLGLHFLLPTSSYKQN